MSTSEEALSAPAIVKDKLEHEDAEGDMKPEDSAGTVSQFRQPTPFEKKEERKFFECSDCGLHEEYNYFGSTPPFCRAIKFLQDSYVVRDPFSAHSGNNADFLLLGSNCNVCSRMTCQDCSVFFTKRFCAQCYKLCSAQLPEELLKSKKKGKD